MQRANARRFGHSDLAHCVRLAFLALAAAQVTEIGLHSAEPWRLSSELRFPKWLELRGEHRSRYETLSETFRTDRSGGDQILTFRTTLAAELKFDSLRLAGELLDSRQALADNGTPLGADDVNALELLQGHLGWTGSGLFENGSQFEARLGRQTLNLGSRRLVARNRFRNTINAFTGALGSWRHDNGLTIQSFYFLPVNRRPEDPARLLDNEAAFDEETFDSQFWGVFVEKPHLPYDAVGEAYVFGLHRDDTASRPTRNESIVTPGLRVRRAPSKQRFDFELESAVQFGESRATADPADRTDLNHFAHMHHAEAGYSFDLLWSPRLAVLYDFASGDADPDDDEHNRFDTLFGARRFEHGPTGIYGAFARSNIHSPGYRAILKPHAQVNLLAAHRLYWLASDTDAWVTSGLRDRTGGSGRFIGNQFELRLRWDAAPGNLRLEAGAARLFAGEFIRNAPNGGQGDSAYGYVQLTLKF